MRSPARSMAGNLIWTRTGTVWAVWRLTPLPYGYRPLKDKVAARALHQALFRSLPGESLILGVCAGMDPAAVVERMILGVDLDQRPEWAAECEASLDTLDAIGIGERLYWLAVPLGGVSGRDQLLELGRAAAADLFDTLGLPRGAVSAREVTRRAEQARLVAQGIPSPFRPTPATPAQLVWLHLHAQQRGLFADVGLPEHPGDVSDQLLVPRSGAAMPEPLLDEGGQSDLPPKQRRSWNPLGTRFLKVAQPHTPGTVAASYQSLLVLSDVPHGGMVFPGSEFLGRIDESGLDVDWAMRLQVRSSVEVARANRRALVNLNEQFGQREGELSHGLSVLERAAEDLAEYAGILESDKLEVEAQVTIVFCVAAPNSAGATAAAGRLADYLGDAGYKLQQPLGYQEDLWWALVPGAPTNRAVREFAQITTSRALSAAAPLASTDLGDTRGSLLGVNISTGRPSAVLHDIAGASHRDVSGSLGLIGEKGAGKSLTMKKLAGDVVDRGGRIIAVDRTPMGEWAVWAEAVTSATVVDVGSPAWSLDPLRLFGPARGARAAQTFLTMLLNVAPTDELGVLVSDVVDPDYLTRHSITALGELPGHLLEAHELPGAAELGRRMNVFARKDLGRVVFDAALTPLDVESPATIIRTHGLELPSAHELLHEHLFKQLSIEKILGRALYALTGALARRICFADRSVLGVYFLDECHHQTSSPEGEAELVEFIRDDRKHNAAVVLGSHDAEHDFGSEVLRGLIPTRILMRHRDRTLARRGLAYLDMDPADEHLVEILAEDTSPVGPHGVEEHRRGEGFIRDSSGSIGRIKVLAPSLPARNKAVRTSPPETGVPGTGRSGRS